MSTYRQTKEDPNPFALGPTWVQPKFWNRAMAVYTKNGVRRVREAEPAYCKCLDAPELEEAVKEIPEELRIAVVFDAAAETDELFDEVRRGALLLWEAVSKRGRSSLYAMPGWRFEDDAVPKRLIALRHLSLGDEGSFNALALKRDPRPNLADGICAAAFEADIVFAFVAQKVDPDVAAELGRKVYFAGRRLAVITPDALPCFGQVRACFTDAFPMEKAVLTAVAGIVDDYRRQDETFRRELAEEEEKAKAQGLQSEETGAKPDSASSAAPSPASLPREGNQDAGAKNGR